MEREICSSELYMRNFDVCHHFRKTWSYLRTADLLKWVVQLMGEGVGHKVEN